jgi:hypothetical protein
MTMEVDPVNGSGDLNSWINIPEGQSGSLLESLDPKVCNHEILSKKHIPGMLAMKILA